MNSPLYFLFGAVGLLLIVTVVPKQIEKKRKASLKAQSGDTAIYGTAANSLKNEKMFIRRENREKGVIGELGVAKDLEYLAAEYGLVVLHDLSMPNSKANIDHVLITNKAIYVIDSKNYSGIVKVAPNKAGARTLRIAGRDQTPLVKKIKTYSSAISKFLESENIAVKVVPLLAFYNAKFHEDTAIIVDGVIVNVFGIENELLRNANIKTTGIDINAVASKILQQFPPKP